MIKKSELKVKLVLVVLACCSALTLSLFLDLSVSADPAANSNAAAGSADDPLVTLGYITKVFTPQLSQTIDKTIANNLKEVNDKINALNNKVASISPSDPAGPSNQAPAAQNASYAVLEMSKGQKLRVKEGTLEIILRPGGTAAVFSDYQDQGLADLTAGDELLNGKGVPVNHNILIPRADGRGITVTSAIAYVMVRGDYEIF